MSWFGRLAPRRRTWLLTGLPRSGSSLCCRLAGEAPDTVALTEPIGEGLMDLADPNAAAARIEGFAREARARILREGLAPSLQVDGALVDDLVSTTPTAGLRQARSRREDLRIVGPLSQGFRLVIKHNALFAALLGRLGRRFPCIGLVRNPVAVLASWRSVNLAVHEGRLPVGERLDPRLARALAAEPGVLARQVIIVDWFFQQFTAHLPARRIVRYEDVVATGGGALHRALGAAAPGDATLASRNANPLYDGAGITDVLAALKAGRRAWAGFYGMEDCERLAADLAARGTQG